MKIETAKKAVALLQGFFNRKLSDEAIAFYVAEFRSTDDEIFETAVAEVCRAEKTLPTPRSLREYVGAAQRSKIESATPKKLSEIFANKPMDSECLAASREILRLVSQGALRGDDLVAEMLLFEETFPGRGWGREARKLKAQLEKQRTANGNAAATRDSSAGVRP